MRTILSIDGGGIRGVIPARILTEIESRAKKRIAEMFDLLVGTSTGGILAAGLAVPGPGGRPKFSARELLDLYLDNGRTIFDRSFWRGITSAGGLADEKYSHAPLERILRVNFRDTTLADCLKPVVLTSYDIEERQPYFFKTTRAKARPERNHYLYEAVRATTAAPTYFEPARVRNLATQPTVRHLVDGGVFVNNPALCAFVEALEGGGRRETMRVVSLGTGVHTRPIRYEEARDWGKLGWVVPIINVMMDGQADAADYHLRQILPDEKKGERQRYFRFDTELDLALDDMDAANKGNLEALRREALQIIERQSNEIDRLVKLLTT